MRVYSVGPRPPMGEILVELRKARGMSMLQTAESLYMSRSRYGAVEKGQNCPSPWFIEAIVKLYRLSGDAEQRFREAAYAARNNVTVDWQQLSPANRATLAQTIKEMGGTLV